MMYRFFKIIITGIFVLSCSTKEGSSSVKPLLVQQLKNSHTNEDWYPPLQKALNGLTTVQSNKKDSAANHSINELSSHLLFWNETLLKAINGKEVIAVEDELTFQYKSDIAWEHKLKIIDSIQTELEITVGNFSISEVEEWGNDIGNIATHTAYHTGQIIYIRKQNGWWK